MNTFREIPTTDISTFKQNLIRFMDDQEYSCILDSNNYSDDAYGAHDCLVAWGKKDLLAIQESKGAFAKLEDFLKQYSKEWAFGYLGYDLKNDLEDLKSSNSHWSKFPESYFFIPEHIVIFKGNKLTCSQGIDPKSFIDMISQYEEETKDFSTPILHPATPKSEYLETVQKIKDHILEGDIYEMNYCVEFTVSQLDRPAADLFNDLNNRAKAPFSAFLKIKNQCILSVSPERYLKKTGNKLVSQPIKGTAPRHQDYTLDKISKENLRKSEKDQAENVMIVDLVRNDLAKVSNTGSVKVDELFGIYPFNTVYQMISTISSDLKSNCSGLDAIKASFPMGSMTGAPKHRSMQLIDKYENSKRGVYSGAVGYFDPNGDFDFNVVIRSLLVDKEQQKASFSVGGAIVYDSSPEGEYEECLVKAKALLESLGLPIQFDK